MIPDHYNFFLIKVNKYIFSNFGYIIYIKYVIKIILYVLIQI